MFQYRQVLVRLRSGESVREIARSGLMGRDKLSALRALAERQGWLDSGVDVPDDGQIAAALGADRRASSTVSSVEPHREVVKRWFNAGVQGRAIHAALQREHAYTGSYSSVVRMLQHLRGEQPPEVTVRLSKRSDPISQWTAALCDRAGWQKAAVGLANKNARILWAVMTKAEAFDARHVSVKPGTSTPATVTA